MPFWPWLSLVQCPSPVSPTGLGWSSYRLPGTRLPALSEPAGTRLPHKHPAVVPLLCLTHCSVLC